MPKKKNLPPPLPSFNRAVVIDVFPDAVSFSCKMSTVGTNLEPAHELLKNAGRVLGYDVSLRDHRTAAQRRVTKIKTIPLVGFKKFKTPFLVRGPLPSD